MKYYKLVSWYDFVWYEIWYLYVLFGIKYQHILVITISFLHATDFLKRPYFIPSSDDNGLFTQKLWGFKETVAVENMEFWWQKFVYKLQRVFLPESMHIQWRSKCCLYFFWCFASHLWYWLFINAMFFFPLVGNYLVITWICYIFILIPNHRFDLY